MSVRGTRLARLVFASRFSSTRAGTSTIRNSGSFGPHHQFRVEQVLRRDHVSGDLIDHASANRLHAMGVGDPGRQHEPENLVERERCEPTDRAPAIVGAVGPLRGQHEIDVGANVEHGREEVGGEVVDVEVHDPLAVGGKESFAHGGAVVGCREFKQRKARIGRHQPADLVGRPVGRAVLGDEHGDRCRDIGDLGEELFERTGDVVGFVVNGDHDRDGRRSVRGHGDGECRKGWGQEPGRRTSDRTIPGMELDTIFKAYDVRGLYPSQIDETVARAVGYAFADLRGC